MCFVGKKSCNKFVYIDHFELATKWLINYTATEHAHMLSVGTQIVVMLGRRITEQYYIKTHTYDDYVNTQLSPTRIAK